jgi:lysozyme
MRTGENGIKLMHYFESLRLEAYPDPATGGAPWTIGYGHTGSDVFKGLVITKERAEELFAKRLESEFEPGVGDKLRRLPTQNQFDAMVSLAYNVGVRNFQRSTLLNMFNVGNFLGASDQFMSWTKAAGKEMLGLKRRRHAERMVFDGYSAEAAIESAKEIK